MRVRVLSLAVLGAVPLAQAQYVEQGDASNVFAEAQDARQPGDPWPVIAGIFHQALTPAMMDDADAYHVCSPYSVPALIRWYPETSYTPQNQPLGTHTFVKLDSPRPTWASNSVDDVRSLSVTPWEAAQCGVIALSTVAGRFTGDSSGVISPNATLSTENSYQVLPLPARRLRPDRLRVLPQVDVWRLPEAIPIECDDVESMAWTFLERNPGTFTGDVQRQIVLLGASCDGVYARAYGNLKTDLAQIRPDGSVVEAWTYNVRFNESPVGYYPAPQNFQNGRDHGAALYQPLQAGNYLAMGLFVSQFDGSVRDINAPSNTIRRQQWIGAVRENPVAVLLLRPSMTWAADPVQVTPAGVTVRWTASRQCLGVAVTLPDHGVARDRLDLFAVGEEATHWSQAAPAGAVFQATLPLSAGTVEAGAVVAYEIEPLCAGLHGDDEAHPALTLTGATTAVVSTDPSPARPGLALTVSPNPAGDRATVHLTSATPQRVTLRVVDALGREVDRAETTVAGGMGAVALDLRALAPGAYTAHATGEAGAVATTRIAVVR